MKSLKNMNLYFFRKINRFYEGRTFLPERLDALFYDKTDDEVLQLKFNIDDAVILGKRAINYEREMFDCCLERQYQYLDARVRVKKKYFELFGKQVDLETIDKIVDMILTCAGDDLMIIKNLKKDYINN